MKTYDNYSTVEIDGWEITFGITDGDGLWKHCSIFGWEFDMTKDCDIEFVEALDNNGDKGQPHLSVVDEAFELAYNSYWENYRQRY